MVAQYVAYDPNDVGIGVSELSDSTISYYIQLITSKIPTSGTWTYNQGSEEVISVEEAYFNVPVGSDGLSLMNEVLFGNVSQSIFDSKIQVKKYDFYCDYEPEGQATLYVSSDGRILMISELYYSSLGERSCFYLRIK